jgi:hypothetical protein
MPYRAHLREGIMKALVPILLLAATVPAFAQNSSGKSDKPLIYDRNSRQVLPYDKRPAACPRSDLTAPACVSTEKPESEKALKPKGIG